MPLSHHYRCTTEWTGAEAGPTRDARAFSRDAQITFAGRPTIAASSAPEYRGSPDRVNPEELFTSSLSLCQMLSYLYLAARNDIQVTAYVDEADGELRLKDGKMRMVTVTLRPTITITATSDVAKAHALVAQAHAECFIANSIACEVIVEATVVVA